MNDVVTSDRHEFVVQSSPPGNVEEADVDLAEESAASNDPMVVVDMHETSPKEPVRMMAFQSSVRTATAQKLYDPPPCWHGCGWNKEKAVDPDTADSWMRVKPRRHGWERPFHLRQIIAWSTKALFMIGTWATVTRALEVHGRPEYHALHVAMHLALSLIFLAGCAFGFATSATDPTDYGDAVVDGPSDVQFCKACRRLVNKSSFHCRACNRCTAGFDHHCKWLNNCIGNRNYAFFYIYVSLMIATVLTGTATSLYLLTNYWDELHPAEIAVTILLTVVALGCCGPMLLLCLLHAKLQCDRMSMLEWLHKRAQALRSLARGEHVVA